MVKKTVEPPKGFHWMKAGKGFKLMKGDYTPHTGAVKKASYRRKNKGKKKKTSSTKKGGK